MIKKVFFILIFIFLTAPGYAQPEREQAIRETERMREKEKIEEEMKKPPEKPLEIKPEEAPIGKEEKKFFIKDITLTGCESFSPDEFSPIIEKYKNKELTLSELKALAKEIEQEYLRRGVIAAVFVPPQDIKDQTAILKVLEARMGELNIQEHKYYKKERLKRYWRVPQGEILRYDRVSKSIQLMNKNPDREVRAALHAGKKPGTTDVTLTPKTHLPVHFTSTFDKEGVVSTGMSRMGLGVRHNNFLGCDDMLITGHTFGSNFGGSYVYHVVPVGRDGASVLYGYSKSRASPKKDYETAELRSRAEAMNISVHQDIYRKDKYLGEAYLGFDAKNKAVSLNSAANSRDRLRIIRLGGNFVQKGFGNITNYSAEYSQGIHALGATSGGNPLVSRGAGSLTSKLNLGIQHKRRFLDEMQASLRLKGQYALNKLTPQEEYALGGIDSVRGYPSGDYYADDAVFASAEMLMPAIFIPPNLRLPYAEETLQKQTTYLAFLDYGWGKRRGLMPFEKDSVDFLGAGVGFRVRLYKQALLRFEWGFPLLNDTISEEGDSRFHFSIDIEERVLEKIEQIRKMRNERKKDT